MLCWAIYRGTWRLFVVILVFNLANLSLFFREIPGPEHWMAGRPLLITTVILVQIAVTLVAVYWGARRRRLIWP